MRTAEKIKAENLNFSHVDIVAGHYASGFALECSEMNIKNLSLKNCYITSYKNATIPNVSAELVVRGLENFVEDNVIIENVNIIK